MLLFVIGFRNGPHNRRQCHRQHDLTRRTTPIPSMLLTHFTVTSSAISDAELRNMVDMGGRSLGRVVAYVLPVFVRIESPKKRLFPKNFHL
jgi:hypothetical protein